MRARMGAAAGLALAGLMLASCSGDDVPGTLPDVTPTTDGPQETTNATPTGDPTAALEAEITAFYEHYVQTINESWTSAEALARRREMFSDSCAECLAGYDFAQRAQVDRLRLEGDAASVARVRIDAVNGDVVTFSTFSNVPAARLIDQQGKVVVEFDEGRSTQTTYQAQRRGHGQWIIISGHTLS
ncbi:MAG TPA: hypothetical protein VFE49_12210 [Jiangellaceae bacterium]|nr:hypothetical protein [Jiangellaceae bacterium]